MDFSIKGKKAIITGGARGIGKSVAVAFVQAGADVAIVDIDIDEASKTVSELAAMGGRAIAVGTDVTDPDQVNMMVSEVKSAFGRIDICFNNAGASCNEPAEDMAYASWLKIIDLNLNAAFLVAQAVGRVMIAQGSGSIINTASMSAHIVNQPQPQCAYNAAKAAVIQLTKSLAVEWVQRGVRVNSISPGYISTDMTLGAPAEWKERWMDLSPAKRMGTPEELTGAVVYLASDAASFTTGTDIIIDGAFVCK